MKEPVRLKAVILKLTPLGESDLIVTLLSAEQGVVRAAARAARSSRKRFGGGLDLFDCGEFLLLLKSDEGRLSRLEGVERREFFAGLRDNLRRFEIASLCFEVAARFAQENDPSAGRLYPVLLYALSALNVAGTPRECNVIGAFILLMILRSEGFDPLEAELQLEPADVRWMEEMLVHGHHLQGDEAAQARRVLRSLVEHIQSIVGEKIGEGLGI